MDVPHREMIRQAPPPDAVHQIKDDGTAIYDDDPIAEEPQLDEDELDGSSENSYGQGEIISADGKHNKLR